MPCNNEVPSKLEVLVDFGACPDGKLVSRTLNALKAEDRVKKAEFKDGAILVETTMPSSEVVELVARASCKRAVLQGFGEKESAVAMISSHTCSGARVMGVVRFQQTAEGPLVIDGSIDGLCPGKHGLHVRTSGDLSHGCFSLGEHYNPHRTPHGGPEDCAKERHAGDLGNICADENGQAMFRIMDEVLKVSEVIGRSVSVSEKCDDLGRGCNMASEIDGNSGDPVACGIIARSAGIFQNPKRICQCDGIVVWDEKDRPLAGKGRREDPCCSQGKEQPKLKACEKEKGRSYYLSVQNIEHYINILKEITNIMNKKIARKKQLMRKDKFPFNRVYENLESRRK